jgi:hypothetical protein
MVLFIGAMNTAWPAWKQIDASEQANLRPAVLSERCEERDLK